MKIHWWGVWHQGGSTRVEGSWSQSMEKKLRKQEQSLGIKADQIKEQTK